LRPSGRKSDVISYRPAVSRIAAESSLRFSIRYALVAMFFVVFDLEAVFLFAWAVAARELGWPGYWAVVLFVATLGSALI
jgi:NADH-quinone oxidoreductase subunit A